MDGKGCRLCNFPRKDELVEAKRQGVTIAKLYKKWSPLMEYKGDKKAFYMILFRHMKYHLKSPLKGPDYSQVSQVPQVAPTPVGEASLEEYAKKLMESAMKDPEMFSGKKISHQAVVAAQRALIEKDKVKVQNDAMKMAFVQLFRGRGTALPEGMVIDGDELLQSSS
jgi:hypothetical protein